MILTKSTKPKREGENYKPQTDSQSPFLLLREKHMKFYCLPIYFIVYSFRGKWGEAEDN